MKRILTILLAIAATISINAQTNVILDLNHKADDKNFSSTKAYGNNLGDSFNVSRLQYYMSKFSILHDGGKETEVKDLYVLIDVVALANASWSEIQLGSYNNITNIEGIKFHIGVNKPENNEDPTQWPANHPLAPKNPSMHWGWTAGYRFVAMEGQSGASLSNPYELHALGNDYYYTIQIPAKGQDVFGQLRIGLNADYVKALEDIDIEAGLTIHGGDFQTIQLLRNFRDYVFTSTDGDGNILAGVHQPVAANALSVYPNPSSGKVSFELTDENVTATAIQISDITGKVVQTIQPNDWAATEMELTTKGVYLVSLMDGEQRLLTKKLVIQ